ncbi:hypothetical protein F2Q68_00042195 [Brassica cretica]|nr:hypothetical protein F2Q68_00042195 [Brassica cretica]
MRSVIPVCSAPPPKPPSPFNESNTSLSSCSAPSSLGTEGQEKKSLIELELESKSDRTHD